MISNIARKQLNHQELWRKMRHTALPKTQNCLVLKWKINKIRSPCLWSTRKKCRLKIYFIVLFRIVILFLLIKIFRREKIIYLIHTQTWHMRTISLFLVQKYLTLLMQKSQKCWIEFKTAKPELLVKFQSLHWISIQSITCCFNILSYPFPRSQYDELKIYFFELLVLDQLVKCC